MPEQKAVEGCLADQPFAGFGHECVGAPLGHPFRDAHHFPLNAMPNFITSKKWPARRIIGAVLAVIVLFYQADQWATLALVPDTTDMVLKGMQVGKFTGFLTGSVIWWYILYRLLRDPDEPKTWHGIPHAILGILFFAFLSVVLSVFIGEANAPLESQSNAAKLDACIARKFSDGVPGDVATRECLAETGMTDEEKKALVMQTIQMADEMSVSERIAWCKQYLPHFWDNDPSLLDAGCNYVANNWQEMRLKLITELNK